MCCRNLIPSYLIGPSGAVSQPFQIQVMNISNKILTCNLRLKSSQNIWTIILIVRSVEVCSYLLAMSSICPTFYQFPLDYFPERRPIEHPSKVSYRQFCRPNALQYHRIEMTDAQAEWCGRWNNLIFDRNLATYCCIFQIFKKFKSPVIAYAL